MIDAFKMKIISPYVLWVDCIGAVGTGLGIIALSGWLSSLSGFQREFVIGHAFVHLVYGSYSFSLAIRKRRPMAMLMVLILANAAWGILCVVFSMTLARSFSNFAVVQFLLEGIYVTGLAVIEWYRRESLVESK